MSDDNEIELKLPRDNDKSRRFFERDSKHNPTTRKIYIVGDDGEYYSITLDELKKCHRVPPDDPNTRGLDYLIGHGIGMGGLEKIEAETLRKNPRFSSTGMWVLCFLAVHYLNLGLEIKRLHPDPDPPPKPKPEK